VKVVEPWKSNISSTAPVILKFVYERSFAKVMVYVQAYTISHIICSQKKLGWREYFQSPDFKKLNGICRLGILRSFSS